jgi:putative holliday junction resolvase
MRYLGIDYGTRKVGLALSDEAGVMGFPHGVVPNDGKLLALMRALVAKENVGAIVIGESRTLGGGLNPLAAKARAFAEELGKQSGVPVHFQSEIFTTQEARRDPEGVWQGSGTVDASAAALILTSYLEHHDNRRGPIED